MPGNIGGAVRRGPRRLESAADGFRDHVRPAREPGVFGDRLDDLLLVEHFLEAVTPRPLRLVGAVGIDDERRLLLLRVEDLPDGVGHADHGGLHHDGGLAGGLDVAGRHGGAGPFVRGEDVFELRPVDQCLVELGILARRIAKNVFHARGDELLGESGAAGALERFHRACHGRRHTGTCTGGRRCRRRADLGLAHRAHRAQHRLGGGHGQAGLRQPGHETAS